MSKLQKMLQALNLELDAAKLATINECNKNAVLQNQLELSVKEKSALERELVAMDELRKENAILKVLSFNVPSDSILLSLFDYDGFYFLVFVAVKFTCNISYFANAKDSKIPIYM